MSGDISTREKSNGIPAIPGLPDTPEMAGDTITTDATGCQTDIESKIREKKADYVLSVKENRPALYLMKSAPVPEKQFSNRRKMLRVSLSDGFLHQVLFIRGK